MVVMKIKGFQKKIMKNDPFDVIFVFQFLPHLVMASYDKTRKNILSLRKMYFSESSQGDLRKYYSYSYFLLKIFFQIGLFCSYACLQDRFTTAPGGLN